MIEIESDPHSGHQRRLAIDLQLLSPKSRRDCHQKIAGRAMIALAFHPVGPPRILRAARGTQPAHRGSNEVMGEDRLRMEAGRVAALLDVDRAIIVRNGDDAPNLSPPMLRSSLFRPDVGILQREPVAMDGRLGGAAGLLQEN